MKSLICGLLLCLFSLSPVVATDVPCEQEAINHLLSSLLNIKKNTAHVQVSPGPQFDNHFTPDQLIQQLSDPVRFHQSHGRVEGLLNGRHALINDGPLKSFLAALFLQIKKNFPEIQLMGADLNHLHVLMNPIAAPNDLLLLFHSNEFMIHPAQSPNHKYRNLIWSARQNRIWRLNTADSTSPYSILTQDPREGSIFRTMGTLGNTIDHGTIGESLVDIRFQKEIDLYQTLEYYIDISFIEGSQSRRLELQ